MQRHFWSWTPYKMTKVTSLLAGSNLRGPLVRLLALALRRLEARSLPRSRQLLQDFALCQFVPLSAPHFL